MGERSLVLLFGRRYAAGMRLLLLLLPLVACISAAPAPDATEGHAIVVCGERFAIDAPVVLWDEPGGYSAYLEGPHFDADADPGRRYSPGRKVPDDHPTLPGEVAERLRKGSASPAELAAFVDLFVLHYDVCGTSELCFRVLQDERHLSVHFLLDLDGTIFRSNHASNYLPLAGSFPRDQERLVAELDLVIESENPRDYRPEWARGL